MTNKDPICTTISLQYH